MTTTPTPASQPSPAPGLLPCPFCAGQARIEMDGASARLYVEHGEDCFFASDNMMRGLQSFDRDAADVLAQEWNSRVQPSPARSDIETMISDNDLVRAYGKQPHEVDLADLCPRLVRVANAAVKYAIQVGQVTLPPARSDMLEAERAPCATGCQMNTTGDPQNDCCTCLLAESAPSGETIDSAVIWDAVTRLERQDSTYAERLAAADGLRALARRATAGTTAPNPPELGGIGAGTTAAPVYFYRREAGENWREATAEHIAHLKPFGGYEFRTLYERATAGNAAPTEANRTAAKSAVVGEPDSALRAEPAGQQEARDAMLSALRKAVVALAHASDNPMYMEAYEAVSSAIEAEVDARCRAEGGNTYNNASPEIATPAATAAPGDLTERLLALSAEYEAKRQAADNPHWERIYLGARDAYSDAALLASNAGAAQLVPKGWQLVPKEPTREMIQACDVKLIPRLALPFFVAAYKTMLDAAPSNNSPVGAQEKA